MWEAVSYTTEYPRPLTSPGNGRRQMGLAQSRGAEEQEIPRLAANRWAYSAHTSYTHFMFS